MAFKDVLSQLLERQDLTQSAMLDVMRQSTEADVSKPDYRRDLAVKLKDVMNAMLEEYEDFGGIEEVMFTSFVMQ